MRPKEARIPQRQPRAREFQRSRLLDAAIKELALRGDCDTSVAVIVARAGVSRKTFYEFFTNKDDCFHAAFEHTIERMAGTVAPCYRGPGSWPQRLRSALAALVALLETEPEAGAIVLSYLAGQRTDHRGLRAATLKSLRDAVDDGRHEASSTAAPPPLTAEMAVGSALELLRTRLGHGCGQLVELINPLMWMIVLPYRGARAAQRELRETQPRPAAKPFNALPSQNKPAMRMTYRTARVLSAIAAEPASSNLRVGELAGISDQGQISKLLARLNNLGLIQSKPQRLHGSTHAWYLTARGAGVEAAVARTFNLSYS
jgi:AcrR family transcriptional regulator